MGSTCVYKRIDCTVIKPTDKSCGAAYILCNRSYYLWKRGLKIYGTKTV